MGPHLSDTQVIVSKWNPGFEGGPDRCRSVLPPNRRLSRNLSELR